MRKTLMAASLASCLLPVLPASAASIKAYAEALPLSSPVKFIGNKPVHVAECNGVQINVTQKD